MMCSVGTNVKSFRASGKNTKVTKAMEAFSQLQSQGPGKSSGGNGVSIIMLGCLMRGRTVQKHNNKHCKNPES